MNAEDRRILLLLTTGKAESDAEARELEQVRRNLLSGRPQADAEAREVAELRRRLGASTRRVEEADAAELRGIERYLKRGTASPEVVKALLPINRRALREDWQLARKEGLVWERLAFTASDVVAWLRAGVFPDEPELADRLACEGVTATMAETVVEHPDTGERMSLVELGRASIEDGYRSLGNLLDLAGIERTIPRRVGLSGRGELARLLAGF